MAVIDRIDWGNSPAQGGLCGASGDKSTQSGASSSAWQWSAAQP